MSKLEKLKDVINHALRDMTMTDNQKAGVYKRISAGKQERKYPGKFTWAYSAGALALVSLLIVFLILPMLPSGAGEPESDAEGDKHENINYTDTTEFSFEVLAASNTPGGITPDTNFYIEVSGGEIDADRLSDLISIEPAVEFTLTPQSDGIYCLSTAESFNNGEIVTVSINGDGETRSWAFQTDATLSVESTLPGDNTQGMPLETGIEIIFSRIVSGGAEKYISISPTVEGKFLYYGKTVVFAPANDLAADTIYTVTISAGLTADSSEVLEEDYSFSFRTPINYSNQYSYFNLSNEFTETFIPGDPLAVGVYSSEDISNVNVEIFKVKDYTDYLKLAQTERKNTHPILGKTGASVPTDGLTKLNSFKTELVSSSSQMYWYGYSSYVMLPDLDAGYYLINMSATTDSGGTFNLQKLIQINNLSVYYQSLNGEALIWLNNAETGTAVNGASVSLNDGSTINSTAATNSDGVARLNYNANESGYAELVIKANGEVFADVVAVDAKQKKSISDNYYTYIYIDRAAYHPTDTVEYWGRLLPKNEATLPSSLDVTILSIGEPRSIGTVEVNPDGSFRGSFSFENYISGYATLSFNINGKALCWTSFNIMEYTKPAYILEVTLDKEYYRAGEDIIVSVHGEFYDGSPAAGLELSGYLSSYNNDYQYFKLDENGNATLTVKPESRSTDWTPTNQYIQIYTSGAEDLNIYAYAMADYFLTDYMLTADVLQDGSLAVHIRSNAINYSALDNGLVDYYYQDYDLLRGRSADVSGSASIIRCYYEKILTGDYYDPINKITVDTYDYIYHEETVYTEEFTTTGGEYTTKPYISEIDDPSSYYKMKIDYTTPDGHYLSTQVYLMNPSYPNYYFNGYYINRDDGEYSGLRLGETVDFSIYGREAVTTGRTLYTTIADTIRGYSISKNNKLSLTFTEDMLPNIILYASYFDGRHVYTVQPAYVYYDCTEKNLNIEITPDSETYKPGETVTASIKVTDEAGNPVAVSFAAGIVDEAAFAIMGQYINPAESLYRAVYYSQPTRYASYIDKNLNDVYAEGGGEGMSNGYRSEFCDTAAFITSKTDSNGNAEISFKVPDNLTSWRITVAAVSDNAYAGSGTVNVKVSIPFFINLVLNKTYTKDDDISLSARVYGAVDGEPVDYTVKINGEIYAEVTGKSGEYTFVNLGKLDCGTYEISIQAKSGDKSDGIIRKITILESRHEFINFLYGDLAKTVNISAVRYPVTMMIYDSSNEVYMSALSALWSMNGKRVDQTLARITAGKLLTKLDPNSAEYIDIPSLESYQYYNGGVRLLAYSDSDALTTALTLIAAPELIDTSAAKSYLYSIINNRSSSSEQVAAAYMGLASLREPILSDIRVLLASPAGLSNSDRIYLACALALLGDSNGARSVYDELIKPQIKTKGVWNYIDSGDSESNYENTIQAALLAVIANFPETEGFIRYLTSNSSAEHLPAFVLMTYVKSYTVPASASSFSCVYNGKTATYTLDKTPVVVLQFNKNELESADFKVISGNISYAASYTGDIGSVKDNSEGKISITTSCGSTSIKPGDNITFTTNVSFAQSCPGDIYLLDIVLPSGTRFVKYDYVYNSGCYLIYREENRLTFVLNRNSSIVKGIEDIKLSNFNVTVYTRAVLPGESVFEEPIVTGLDAPFTAVGERIKISVE